MADIYLHDHPDFADLIRIVAADKSIDPVLVEKDYWIMHALFGLQQIGLLFELKGGTSLSKGYGIIARFSEDIDIRIEPPKDMGVKTGPNHNKPAHCHSRKSYYDWLAQTITIAGIQSVSRDCKFDDLKYRRGGVRLHYTAATSPLDGIKEGILLELGFDTVTPNSPATISSWAYDHASGLVNIRDNRAHDVACYHPGYTLVEKLQTISTKYRQQQASGDFPRNFMRHYYDVYCLLQHPDVQAFVGSDQYYAHKKKRFRSADNPLIAENDAFLLSDPKVIEEYRDAYRKTRNLYYLDQPPFEDILLLIEKHFASL